MAGAWRPVGQSARWVEAGAGRWEACTSWAVVAASSQAQGLGQGSG